MNSPFNVDFDKGILYPLFYYFLSIAGLYVAIEDAVAHGIFKDLQVEDKDACISHFLCIYCNVYRRMG